MATKALTHLPTELAKIHPGGSLYSFDEMYRFAQVCHASGLFEGLADAAQAFVKIARGQELGIPPMAAMQAFDIIKRQLFIKPWAIAAKINACGYGAYRVTEQTKERCTIVFSRKDQEGWQTLAPVVYTIVEARAHGLVDRSPHWKASPENMLYNRCMGRGGAMHFPELLAGLSGPPDLAPVTEEQMHANIEDLFGDVQPMRDVPPMRDVTPALSPTPPPDSSWWLETIKAHWRSAPAAQQAELRAIAEGRVVPADSDGLQMAHDLLDYLDHAWSDARQEEGS